jgi:hypothetical protein
MELAATLLSTVEGETCVEVAEKVYTACRGHVLVTLHSSVQVALEMCHIRGCILRSKCVISVGAFCALNVSYPWVHSAL